MDNDSFLIEDNTPFSESLIWQLNRDYYNNKGLDAWRDGTVPHHLTSNSMVGRTYAELIFGFLKDLSYKGHQIEKVYILELGAGHGRLCFHILKHLDRLVSQIGLDLPPYCYILSDIVEENLQFFETHQQFQTYLKAGKLDVAHFDAIQGDEIKLRYTNHTITKESLQQPILVLANYFFDSIPKDLFLIQNQAIAECLISLTSKVDTTEMSATDKLDNINVNFSPLPYIGDFYKEPILNEILESYQTKLKNTHLFFPYKGILCLQNLQQLSKKGMVLLTMDKGFHELHDLENAKLPEMITHGSMSFYVNYHAFIEYCQKMGGTTYFPTYSTFHLQLGCLLFTEESDTYTETKAAYHRVVNEYGPDDFYGQKKFHYKHIARMTLPELVGLLRLSAYDSTLFKEVLPRLKQVATRVTFNERTRLAQTMHQTWNMYFNIDESEDIAFEMAGLFYSLGYYEEALSYYEHSIQKFGHSKDGYYNIALCHYQLRQDEQFLATLKDAKTTFPDYERYAHLDKLDLNAK